MDLLTKAKILVKLRTQEQSTEEMTEKAGARHTGKEYGWIQEMHDLAVRLGADCGMMEEKAFTEKRGTPSSGNWGHKGRPGKKGGSSKGGGHARIGAKKGSSPQDIRAAAKKFREGRGKGKGSGGSVKVPQNDLTKLSSKETTKIVNELAQKPIKELRHRQDLVRNQIENTVNRLQRGESSSHLDRGLRNLQVMDNHLIMAINKKEFG